MITRKSPKGMFTLTTVVLILTATTTALMAGLFYAWSISVMPGLARVPDTVFIASLQAMNKAILNPLFFAAFLGTVLLLPLSTYLNYSQPVSARFWLLLAASILYLAGVFGVTMAGNVPLNNALESFQLQGAPAADMAAQRAAFEETWNRLNTVRAVSATLSMVLVIMACLSPADK